MRPAVPCSFAPNTLGRNPLSCDLTPLSFISNLEFSKFFCKCLCPLGVFGSTRKLYGHKDVTSLQSVQLKADFKSKIRVI